LRTKLPPEFQPESGQSYQAKSPGEVTRRGPGIARRELIGIQQIQYGHVEVTEQQIRHGWREHAYTLQHVVEVRLGDAGAARKASFRQFTTLDTLVNVRNQPELQQLEIYGVRQ